MFIQTLYYVKKRHITIFLFFLFIACSPITSSDVKMQPVKETTAASPTSSSIEKTNPSPPFIHKLSSKERMRRFRALTAQGKKIPKYNKSAMSILMELNEKASINENMGSGSSNSSNKGKDRVGTNSENTNNPQIKKSTKGGDRIVTDQNDDQEKNKKTASPDVQKGKDRIVTDDLPNKKKPTIDNIKGKDRIVSDADKADSQNESNSRGTDRIGSSQSDIHISRDSDGDGWPDDEEVKCKTNPTLASSVPIDTDRDHTCDAVDIDDDNDNVVDAKDSFPLNEKESLDFDGDGIGNNADIDDDNDGYADTEDAFPLNANEWLNEAAKRQKNQS